MTDNQNRKSDRKYCSNSQKIHQDQSLSNQYASKFQFNQPESIETKLIRTLINIAYKYEVEIIRHLREFYLNNEIEKKFTFIIDKGGYERFRCYKGDITQINLQNLLHIREATFVSWLRGGWIINSLHNKTFVNLISSVKNFPVGQIRDEFWNSIMEYTKNHNHLEFTSELLLIFNENSKKSLNYKDISDLLNFHNAYLVQNFHYSLTFETYNKYFNLLVAVFLLKKEELKISSNAFTTFKKKSYKLIFNTMVSKKMLKAYRKLEFEILFSSLLYINMNRKIKDGKHFERFELVDLSSKISDEGYRYIFSESFRDDYSIKRGCFKLKNLLEAMCVIKTPEFVIDKIDQYLVSWDRDYHEYWQLLYPMHVKDLLLFTLGFNIESFQFFEDAQPELWQLSDNNISIYRIDIDRHHLDLDAEYYLPLNFSKNKGYVPKIAPLSHSDHTKITNQIKSGRWENINYKSNLYKSRLTHLFELILKPNKSISLEEEIKKRIDSINSQNINIWEGINTAVVLELKRRLADRKKLSKIEFLEKYYKSFYLFKYKPHLKKCEHESSGFWFWYNNNYLKERQLLFNKLKDFYKI